MLNKFTKFDVRFVFFFFWLVHFYYKRKFKLNTKIDAFANKYDGVETYSQILNWKINTFQFWIYWRLFSIQCHWVFDNSKRKFNICNFYTLLLTFYATKSNIKHIISYIKKNISNHIKWIMNSIPFFLCYISSFWWRLQVIIDALINMN